MDGGIVALNVETGTCHGFNPTAARIWQLLETPRSFAALLDALLVEYEVERGRCEAELAEALDQMRRDGLVETPAPPGA